MTPEEMEKLEPTETPVRVVEQANEFVPSRFPDPAFPGQLPPGADPMSVEAPRVPFQVPSGGPEPPQLVDPQPGRSFTQMDALPSPGDFPWPTRFFAPGLDLSAIDAFAVRAGHLAPMYKGTSGSWLDISRGQQEADSPLAGFMAYAFASSFDQVCKHWAGQTPLLDHAELLKMLAFGYAACVRLAEKYPGEHPPPVRPEPRGDAPAPPPLTHAHIPEDARVQPQEP